MPGSTTALLTDHYELTMLRAALEAGTAERRCAFTVFARSLPGGRRYGVVAGTGRLLDALADFTFDEATLSRLKGMDVIDDQTCDWLADYRCDVDIDGYAEGEPYFPGSPVLVVEGTFGAAVILETLVLSVLNFDSAIATAAARMVFAASGRPLIEMGSRRTHEQAAVAAARAAYLAGFSSTSNLEARQRYGIPTTGTSAHAFTLLFGNEREAFAAQLDALGRGTTLLVDTYDVETAIRTAVELAGPKLGAIRLDSGDLIQQAVAARALLDRLGAHDTRIVVTSDLDEHAIAALASAPVDSYGVGTSVVTGSGVPTAGFVYKLTARQISQNGPLAPVAKSSPGKQTRGGRPYAVRRHEGNDSATEEVVITGAKPEPASSERLLLRPLLRRGERVDQTSLEEARQFHRDVLAQLPASAKALSRGDPALPTVYEERHG